MNWKLTLTPQAQSAPGMIVVSAQEAVLWINGAALDLSFLAEGDKLPVGSIDHPLLQGAEIYRLGDQIKIDGLLFPLSLDQDDPAACFPESVIVTSDGPIPLPPQFPSALKAQITESEVTPDAEQH